MRAIPGGADWHGDFGRWLADSCGADVSFGEAGGKIRVERVVGNPPFQREHHEAHVFHRNRAKQYLVTENDDTHITTAILEAHANRPDVWTKRVLTVCRGHFLIHHRF